MTAVIVDVGTGFLKAGLQTDPAPTAVYPTLVARPRRRYAAQYEGSPAFVGDDAINQRHQLSFSYPVDHGHIDDWEDLESLWNHVFSNGLSIDTSGRPILLTEPPMASTEHRSRLVETMIEHFDFSEVNLSVQGILALYAAGRSTGLVVETGEGVTQVVPVMEGFTDKSAIRRSDFAGLELTLYLQKMLADRGYSVTRRDDFEHVRIIKETLCYCALDPVSEDAKGDEANQVTYELPDGMSLLGGETSVTLGNERFYCAEALFEPRLMHRDNPGITELIWQAVQACPIEARKAALQGVVVSGGTSLFPGFPERLEAELKRISPPQARAEVRVHASPDRLFGVWLGGKNFCSPSMRPMQDLLWVTKADWYEEGPSVVERKTHFRHSA